MNPWHRWFLHTTNNLRAALDWASPFLVWGEDISCPGFPLAFPIWHVSNDNGERNDN